MRVKFLAFGLSLLLISQLTSQNIQAQTTVSDGDDLQEAVNNASPGDIIIVENGTYNDFESTFEVSGTLENPIHIKAETIGGVTLIGESHFVFKKSAHIIIEGFVFDAVGDDTLIKLEGSNHIRITRNVFELETTESVKWVFIGGFWNDYNFEYMSHNNRIDHNVFQNKTTPGHYITIDGTNNEERTEYRQSQYDRIDHNHFKNNSPRAANEQESIRIGWSQMSMSSGFTIVEHNLFEECDGDPEIISVKSSDNIIRYNTFRRSYGTLSLRHGNRNWVEGNYFFGGDKPSGTFETSTINTGGIRIYGTDHVIINNYMEGLKGTRWDAPIALTQGDAIDGESSSLSKHFRAERVTIANNTLINNKHGIEVGFDNNGSYSKGLKDITIANNIVTGSENSLVTFMDGNDQGEDVNWINNVFYPQGSATVLSGGNAFSEDEALEINPQLNFEDSLWRSTESTQTFDNVISGVTITKDIDGQIRATLSTVGADHFSTDSVYFRPLSAEDVGPFATGNDDSNSESLFISTLNYFSAEAGTQALDLTSNFDWNISTNDPWISITPATGSGNAELEISVTENPSLAERNGSFVITGESLTREISVNQRGANSPSGTVKIEVVDVTASSEQAPENVKENVIDNDLNTRWSAEGEGEFIVLDLGAVYDIKLIKVAVHKGTERFVFFDLTTSENGTDYVVAWADTSNTKTTDELENFVVDVDARYVKLIGYGNSNSAWTSISEIEVYAIDSSATSTKETSWLPTNYKLIGNYPNPFNPSTNIQFELPEIGYFNISIFSIHGQLLRQENGLANAGVTTITLNFQDYPTGIYFYQVSAVLNGQTSLIGTGRMTLIK